jgi:hypothetical protein
MAVARESLYDEVWAEPMTKVAARHGVSSSFLARVCERLNVPRPARGYCARLEIRKAPAKPALLAVLDLSTGGEIRREITPAPSGAEIGDGQVASRQEDDESGHSPLFAVMLALLEKSGFKTLYLPQAPVVWACQCGNVVTYSLQFIAREESSTIICRTRLPISIPPKLRWRAMEFATRANEQLVVGAFELSLQDGDMWFRKSCMFGDDGLPTASMIGGLASLRIEMSDLYVPLLLATLYGKRPVQESVAADLSA